MPTEPSANRKSVHPLLTVVDASGIEIEAYPRTHRPNLKIIRLIENQGNPGDSDGHDNEANAEEYNQLKLPFAVQIDMSVHSFNIGLSLQCCEISMKDAGRTLGMIDSFSRSAESEIRIERCRCRY
jgi:hypothetical protein